MFLELTTTRQKPTAPVTSHEAPTETTETLFPVRTTTEKPSTGISNVTKFSLSKF